MSGFPIPVPKARFFDADGAPLAGGKLSTYEAGTDTPLATYSDDGLSVPNTNPVVLDANGEASIFIAGGTAYKFVLTDAADAPRWTVDGVEVTQAANLATLNASNITTGTLDDARLSANVPLADTAEAIAGVWAFTNGLKERSRTAPIGEWTQVAFDAANFTGNNSMTWTVASGNVLTQRYMMVGKTMTLAFCLNATTPGGTADLALQMAIPGGYVAAYRSELLIRVVDGGVAQTAPGMALVQAGIGFVQFYADCSTAKNWTLGASKASVFGCISFEVQ